MTIAELIEKLNTFPKDSEVLLVDADTEWHFNNFHVEQGKCGIYDCDIGQKDTVYIFGTYHENR